MKEKGFWEGAQAAMPTALGYVSIGLACGIIGAPYVTPVEMGLMSLFVYAGSAQFAMLALIAVQAPVAAIAMTVFLINLRLFLLSLHASTYFRHTSLWQNIGMSSLLTDETYGVLMGELAHTDKVHPMWMHGNNLNSYVAWFIGTLIPLVLTLPRILPNFLSGTAPIDGVWYSLPAADGVAALISVVMLVAQIRKLRQKSAESV